MFKNWFRKKEEKVRANLFSETDIQDAIEESLWEIKEEYDLPTEEVVNVVYSKRKNLDYMHEKLSEKKK
jgi:chorismate mutase